MFHKNTGLVLLSLPYTHYREYGEGDFYVRG
jgi:hypothetical protein